MKLYCSLTSPYARKVRVAVRELGLSDRVEEIVVDPWASPPQLLDGNPLCKVPALLTAAGIVLPDSQLILDYLAETCTGFSRTPNDTVQRWQVARRTQLADGLIDAAVAMVIELLKRPQEYRWPDWLARQRRAIALTLEVLEPQTDKLATDGAAGPTEITLGCALAYLDFRFPDLGWRHGHPALTAWQEDFAARPSMRDTQPPA